MQHPVQSSMCTDERNGHQSHLLRRHAHLKSPQISANASSLGLLAVDVDVVAADAPDEPHTSCVSNNPPPPPPPALVGAAPVDQGLLCPPPAANDAPLDAAGFAADVDDRSRPPNDELSPASPPAEAALPPEGAGVANEPKSPNPAPLGAAAAAGLATKSDMMSFLPLAPVEVAEVGLVADDEAEGSCQSRSKIPPPAPPVDLGGAGSAGAGFAVAAGAVFGAVAGEASSSRSTTGAGLLGATFPATPADALVAAAGAAAAGVAGVAPSSTLGSVGGGPSLAHRLDSYLLRINDSIL